MFSLDFLTWNVVYEMAFLPTLSVAAGLFLGVMISDRIKATNEKGRFRKDSFAGVVFLSIGNLPTIWGLQIGLDWAVRLAPFPDFVREWALRLIFTLFIWTVATFVQRTLYQIMKIKMEDEGANASTSLLLHLIVAVVYGIGALIVLDSFGISVAPLLTAVGIGGMAVAMGLQETMANIFAGLHILITRQVRIGDHIRIESGAEGQIVDITWRYAKIYTITNNIIIVPNSKLASSVITNYDMAPDKLTASVADVAFTVNVGVSYDSDLDKVERVILEVAREVFGKFDPDLDTSDGAPTAPAVRFHTFGDSSIDMNVILHTSSFRLQYFMRHEFIKALKKRFDAEGIDIPFPIRDVRLKGSAS